MTNEELKALRQTAESAAQCAEDHCDDLLFAVEEIERLHAFREAVFDALAVDDREGFMRAIKAEQDRARPSYAIDLRALAALDTRVRETLTPVDAFAAPAGNPGARVIRGWPVDEIVKVGADGAVPFVWVTRTG